MHSSVTEDNAGQRLDTFIASKMPRLSRAFVQKLGEEGKILVNGVQKKTGYKLRENDEVAVDYNEAELDAISVIDLPILYEDGDCVVINKPAGVLSHSQGGNNIEATVATFLRGRVVDIEGERAGIVHRLDRATSGVMIGAKNQAALSWLQKQFARRKVKKSYIAIAEGYLKQPEAIINMPIARNPKAPATFRVGANGKTAITHYKVIQEHKGFSAIELTPETGRTHQLRVHLAHIGHPIVGDPLYGNGHYGDRLFLHALNLEITLPNRERKIFAAPLPPEFSERMK